MRTDLIVKRHNVVTVERAEQNAITGVRLPHQGLDRAQHVRLGAKNLERIFAGDQLDLTVAQESAPALARQVHTVARDRRDETDSRMRDEALVKPGPASVGQNLLEQESSLCRGEVHQRKTGAVGDHYVVRPVHSILLGENDFPQTVAAAQPVSKSANAISYAEGSGCQLCHGLDDPRSHVGVLRVLGKAGQRSRRLPAHHPRFIQNLLNRRPERFTVLHPIAQSRRHAMVRENDEIISPSACKLRHSPDLGDACIGPSKIGKRLLARRAEVVSQFVVLHERAVDDRHAKIDIEQDCHRL